MNKLIILFLLCITHFANAENSPYFSECYSYHTPHFYEVFIENNQVIFQHTVKDPNGISYVSRDKIVLDAVNCQDFKLISEDDEKILISNFDGYFFIKKDPYELNENRVSKIYQSNSITRTIGTDFIYKNDTWYYVNLESYSKEINEEEVKNVPHDLEIFKSGIKREGTLYKNKEAVYVFDNEKLSFKAIPKLTGKDTHYVKQNSSIIEGFIYDNDTFYYISYHDLIDYTEQFTSHPEFTNFKSVEIIENQYDYSIDTKDGIIWLILKFSIRDKMGKEAKIIPIKATYFGKNRKLLNYNNKIYIDFNDLLNDWNSIDISTIQNPSNLTQDPYFYNDGKMRYILDYDNDTFKSVEWLPVEAIFYPPNDTYGFLSNRSFYADKTNIYFIEKPEKKSKTIKHISDLIDLKLAYAFDDKLLIENKIIKNNADRESMVFIGSTVDVISECDGGRGQYPVKIDVYYFFKDKNGVYVYNTLHQKMRKLENQNPAQAPIDDCYYVMNLMRITKNLSK